MNGPQRPSHQHVNHREFAEYSRCVGLEGLEVVRARWVEHSFAPHMHDFYAVSLNYGGRGAFDCRHAAYDAAPGSCNLIAPGEVHTGHSTAAEGWAYRNLYIDPPLMALLLRSLDWHGADDPAFVAPLVRDPILAVQLARIFASLEEANALLQNESRLLAVIARLATSHFAAPGSMRDAGREHAPVRRVKHWLDDNCRQNVSIHELAALAALSPYYLVRAFHKHCGMPPHRYQTMLRVHRARRLLIAGVPIAEVAYQTGFCDQSHLNRCFKRTLGITPGRYVALRGRAPLSTERGGQGRSAN